MARVLTFGSDETDKQRYRFLLAAALNGPAVDKDGQQKRRSWDEQRSDGKVLRALKAVSIEESRDVPGQDDPVRYLVLKPDGGAVTLTGEQFEKLKGWWALIQWPTYDIDAIEDAYEWLMSAPDGDATKD